MHLGLNAMPGSIRGKLILAFLVAAAPVIGVQICSIIDDLVVTRSVCVGREKILASSAASSISLDVMRIKQRHRTCAQNLLQTGLSANSIKLACSAIDSMVDCTLKSAFIKIEPGKADLSTSAIGKTTISDIEPGYGNLPKFSMVTPIRSGSSAGQMVTIVDSKVLMEHIPNFSAYGWSIGSRSGGRVIWGKGSRYISTTNMGPEKYIDGSGHIRRSGCPLGNGEFIGSIAPVRGTQWNLMVVDTANRALAPEKREIRWFTASLAAIALGLLGILWLGNALAYPVRKLAHAAGAIAVGDYGRRVSVRTGDELQMLGESFNAIGESLTHREAALREQTEMVIGMAEASRVVSSSLNIRECGRTIARVMCTHMGANDAAVFRKDSINGGLKVIGRCGKCNRAVWRRLASHSADSGGYLVISEQQTGEADEDVSSNSFLVGVPLSTGPVSLGAIVVRFEGEIDKNDLQHGSAKADLLTAFGVHAAAAIRNAEVYSQTERYSEVLEDWVEHLSSVMQVTNAISPSLDIEQTLAALARATTDVLHADACAIFLPDRNGKLVIRSCCNFDTEFAAKVKIRPGQGETGRAFAEMHYRTCVDAAESADPATRKLAQAGCGRGLLSSPLMIEDRAIGVITVYSEKPREFTGQEIRLLSSIGLHAAVIVRNASLYTREAYIAETLQKGLVPDVPDKCHGLSFAGRYVPALDEARVGGDFYDVVELPNGMVGIIIGDVSGKGLRAAIHLATCKYMMKSLMYTYPDDPGLVLNKLNDAFNHYFDLSFFVTVFYAVVDTSKGIIYYANAGHPPALLISQGGKMQTCLTATGTPVGSGYQSFHESRHVVVKRQDMLLLYTDGATDSMANDTMLGVEGLQRMVFEAGGRPAPELIEWMCSRLSPDPGSPQRDDMALLAVSFEGVMETPRVTDGGTDESEYRLAARTA